MYTTISTIDSFIYIVGNENENLLLYELPILIRLYLPLVFGKIRLYLLTIASAKNQMQN